MNTCLKAPVRMILLIIILISAISLSACGVKQIEIDVPDAGLNLITNAAPSEDYAFYVASGSEPKSVEDLRAYSVVTCTGETTANRAIQIGQGLGMTQFSVSGGYQTTECIKENIEEESVLIVAQRSVKPPSKVTEIVFK